ncbi:MAG: sulfate transporter family protein [Hyphomicrobiales bacterium]|nr:sulfate transporter family protein [Hyphomicrobiales bacterium]MBV8825900.1 sulfate transporter family protein [Hyphomicrobiales bacterium]
MLDAALKALEQLFSPPFRSVLLKSIALALVLLFALGIGLQRLIAWLIAGGGGWLETALGLHAHGPVTALEWVLTIAAGLGLIAGAIFLMPAVTSLVAGLYADEIADLVEREYYPGDVPGVPVPIGRALIEGVKAALLALVVYLVALPFLLLAGIGAIIFFIATAFLLGRVYFELAAMRFHPVADAKRLRKARQGSVFVAGLLIAAFVSIPIVNLATPLFGMALMVHVHKRLTNPRNELLERAAR